MKKKKNTPSNLPPATTSGASIYDVAKQADVSIVTVSRVFNDYPHVSQRMRDRVFAAARAAGYTPRLVSKPKVLAVIIGHLDHLSAGDYKTRLLLYLVQAAAKVGYLVEFIPYDAAELATKHLVDAVIEVGLTDAEITNLAHLPPVPTVLINKQSPRAEWSTAKSDQFYEGQLAAQHLLEMGHRRIALIVDDPRGWGVEQRRAGYETACRRRDPKGFRPMVIATSEIPAPEAARQVAASHCTACINFTDNFGFAVLDSLARELKLRIPEDLSVVSLENKAVSPFWNPPLTTIEQPLQEIAEGTVHGILEQLGGRAGKKFDLTFKCKLTQRSSVAKLR